MPAVSAQGEPRVIVVASAAAERCAQICRALGAAGVQVTHLPDVYLALGEITANSDPPVRTVVVQAAGLNSSEFEFFPLAGHLVAERHTYVFTEGNDEESTLRSALAAGAKKLDMTGLDDWAAAIADATSLDEPNEPPSNKGTGPEHQPAATIPDPDLPAAGEAVSPDSSAVGDAPDPDFPADDQVSETPPIGATHAEPPPESAAPPEPERAPTPDLRVARPIAMPAEWPIRPVSPMYDRPTPPEDDTAAPAFPWRPTTDRPMRTPPIARAPGPTYPDRSGPDVEITREEIDALLNDQTRTPDARRHDR